MLGYKRTGKSSKGPRVGKNHSKLVSNVLGHAQLRTFTADLSPDRAGSTLFDFEELP